MNIIEELRKVPPEQRQQWLRDHAHELTEAQLLQVQELYYEDLAGEDPQMTSATVQTAIELAEGKRTESRAQTRYNEKISAFEEQTGEAAPAEVQDAIAAEEGITLPARALPRWATEVVGNRELTSSEQFRILDRLNQFYPDLNASDLTDPKVQKVLESPTDRNINILQTAIADTPIVATVSVNLGAGRHYTVSADQFVLASERYGVSQESLAGIVQLADLGKMYSDYGQAGPFGQQMIYWQPLAGLMKATGLLDQAIAKYSTTGAPAREKAADYPFAIYNQDLRERASADGTAIAGELFRGRKVSPDPGAGVPSQIRQLERSQPAYRVGGVQELSSTFNAGMRLYNDALLAMIHSLDRNLASEIAGTARNGGILRPETFRKVQTLANMAGHTTIDDWVGTIVDLGDGRFETNSQFLADYFQRQAALNEEEPEGRVRVLPDPERIRQNAKDFIRELFMDEPDDTRIEAIVNRVIAAVQGAPDDQDVDINAQIRKIAEEDPQYAALYGQKPAGMSELEYQAQFRAAQGSILGDEAGNNDAVKLGMRGGKYQTTVGAATGTREAWDNSTFLGRLARAAQLVNENT
jgi:hypothetical protein